MNRSRNQYQDQNDFSSSRNYRNTPERNEDYERDTPRKSGYAWSQDQDKDTSLRRSKRSDNFDDNISEDYGSAYRSGDRSYESEQRDRFDNEGGAYRKSQKNRGSQRSGSRYEEDEENDNRSDYSRNSGWQNYENDEDYENRGRGSRSGQSQDHNRSGRFREENDDNHYRFSGSNRTNRSGNYEDANEQDWSRGQSGRSGLNRNMYSRQSSNIDNSNEVDDEEGEYRFPGGYSRRNNDFDKEDYQSGSSQGRGSSQRSYESNQDFGINDRNQNRSTNRSSSKGSRSY